ncbi:MAG: glycosyltransferase family 1 protein [Candidatus Gastranaerophilales bacterium]
MKNKYHLVYDASVLANEFSKNDARSGIFFVGKNLFHQLLKSDELKISLYCNYEKIPYIKRYLELYSINGVEIINECEFNLFHKMKYDLRIKKDSYSKRDHKFKRSFYSLLLLVVSFICKVHFSIYHFKKLNKNLSDVDFYLSPLNEVPNIVKKQKHIVSSVCLYDTIPLIYKNYYPQMFSGNYWFIDLINNFSKDEIYFAISESTKKDFLHYCPVLEDKQISVTYLGASDRFYQDTDLDKLKKIKDKYNIPQNGKYIFSLCTLDPRKNLIFAVKNFIEFVIKNEIDDLYFVLGGAAWKSFINKINEEIGGLGEYENKIVRAGYIDDEDLSCLYSNSFCFACPSIYEGFGMPVLEAMQCGSAVITSNVSSLPEVIGDAGIQIDPTSDDELVQAFEKYYYDENYRKEMSQKGLERSKEFSWEKCSDVIVEKFISTLKTR